MSTLVAPDEVLTETPEFNAKPDVCSYCGAHYQAGPEGTGWAEHLHCWACGFDPTRPAFAGGGAPLPSVVGIPAQFAQQLAAEVHAALGLAPGENLGDVIAEVRNSRQPALVDAPTGSQS